MAKGLDQAFMFGCSIINVWSGDGQRRADPESAECVFEGINVCSLQAVCQQVS